MARVALYIPSFGARDWRVKASPGMDALIYKASEESGETLWEVMPMDTVSTDNAVPGRRLRMWLLRVGDAVERWPSVLFAVALLALAVLPSGCEYSRALLVFAFFLGDWTLLLALPKAGRSFGPAKPQALALAILRLPFAFLPVSLPVMAAIQVVGTLLHIYGFWIEPQRLVLARQTFHSPKMPSSRTLRLLHLSDLHVERLTDRERRVISMIRETEPDIIVLTGDYLSLSCGDDPAAMEAARAVLQELSAPLGVYAVSGSEPVDKPEVLARLFEGLPIKWLRDERVSLHLPDLPIELLGISCTHDPAIDASHLLSAPAASSDRFTVLLYHTPDLAPEAARAGVDLMLCGHTHGGQVRLPFVGALYASSLYGTRFSAGRYQVGAMTLYVSRGVGLEGRSAPRVRFLCPPEVVLWEISAYTGGDHA